jgi:hypothetical protein
MYMQGSPAEIQIPAHWNLIGHNMIAPPLALSPSSIFRYLRSTAPSLLQGKIRHISKTL